MILGFDIGGNLLLQSQGQFMAVFIFHDRRRRKDFYFHMSAVYREAAGLHYFVDPDYRDRKNPASAFGQEKRARLELADTAVFCPRSFREDQKRTEAHLLFDLFQGFDGAPPVFSVDRDEIIKQKSLPENRNFEKLFFCQNTHVQRQYGADYRDICDALVVRGDKVSLFRIDVFKPFDITCDTAYFHKYAG